MTRDFVPGRLSLILDWIERRREAVDDEPCSNPVSGVSQAFGREVPLYALIEAAEACIQLRHTNVYTHQWQDALNRVNAAAEALEESAPPGAEEVTS